ncbi:MAG: XdhC/CoxI family protein [Lachnospiraceae bacterium]
MNVIEIVKEQMRAYEEGKSCAVVTIVEADGSTPRSKGKMIVYTDGSTKGTIGGGAVELLAIRDARECIRKGENLAKTYDLNSPSSETGMTCGGCMTVLIEAFAARPLLVVCGAGHVGGAVLHLASFVGFDTLLIDDREEAAIADKIALADRFVRVKGFEEEVAAMDIRPDAYYLIATHGHSFDGEALAAILTKEAKYIGMIGSSKKIEALFGRLKEKGFTQEQLDKVYTPVGLDLGGETPEEIAVAVIAEVMAVKYGHTGEHLTGKEK